MAGREGTGGEPPGTAAGGDRRRGDRRRTAGHGGFLIREEALRRKMWGLYLYI